MSSIKCSYCAYRNVDADEKCANCGASLPRSLAEEQTVSFLSASAPDGMVVSAGQALYIPPLEEASGPLFPDAQHLHSEPGGFLSNLPDPFVLNTPAEEEEEQSDQDPPALSWSYPWREPDVIGTVIYAQTQQESPDYPGVVFAAGALLLEMLSIVPSQGQRGGERVPVTTLRIRTEDGTKKDARLTGFLRGANISQGDVVTLWGWKRRGSLIIRVGYNHTTRARITTRTASNVVSPLLALCFLFLVVVLLVYWSNTTGFWTHIVAAFKTL